MSVTLDHTIVAARDKEKTAQFLTELLGLLPYTISGHFTVVQVDDTALDILETDTDIQQRHFAFCVSEPEFDQIFARIQKQRLPYWADPMRGRAGQIYHRNGGRGVYFDDPNGHLLEILTRPADSDD